MESGVSSEVSRKGQFERVSILLQLRSNCKISKNFGERELKNLRNFLQKRVKAKQRFLPEFCHIFSDFLDRFLFGQRIGIF